MNRIARTILFTLTIVVATSCATTQPTPTLTKVSHAVDCTKDEVQSQIPSIVTTIATNLLSHNYVGLLINLARQVGEDAVICGVQFARADAVHRASLAPGQQPNADLITQHATEYLSAREVTFVQ